MGVDSVDLDFFGLRAFFGFVLGEDPWNISMDQSTQTQHCNAKHCIGTWVGVLLLLGDIGEDVESELFLFLLFTFLEV